jgi:membrane fusion protein, adhesin transport system
MLQRLLDIPFTFVAGMRLRALQLYKLATGHDVLQDWLQDRQLQISFLSQSAQLEEAGKPGLVSATLTASCLCVAGFLTWAALARLNEVTRAPGEVLMEGALQSVQHPDGGVVAEILVKEGDTVQMGQPLLVLAPSGLAEDVARARQKQIALYLQKERLEGLLEGRAPDFGKVEGASEAQLVEQQKLLDVTTAARTSERDMLEQQMRQRTEDVRILQTSLATGLKRMKLMQEALDSRSELSAKGYYPAIQILQMKSDVLALRGQTDETATRLTQARAALAEGGEKLAAFEHTRQEELRSQLEVVGQELVQNAEVLNKVDARERNLTLRSPVRGVVKGLSAQTLGGVVMPGAVLMDIVPLDRPLLVEARVAPQDIGHLQVGQVARVKVSAFDFSRYGELEGRLAGLSAAAFTGERGERYFKVRITLDKAYVGGVPGRNTLTPGMTVMADIVTGERSILSYLFRPIETAFQLALHEH